MPTTFARSFGQKTSFGTSFREEPFSVDKLGRELFEKVNRYTKARVAYNKTLDKFWRDARDIKMEKLLPHVGCANFSVPITSSAIDGIVPRMSEGLFDFDPPILVKAQNTTAEQYKSIYEKWVRWVLDTHPDVFSSMWHWIGDTCWSGTGLQEVLFEKEKGIVENDILAFAVRDEEGRLRPIIAPQSSEPMPVNEQTQAFLLQQGVQAEVIQFTRKERKWIKYEPVLRNLDIKDVYFAPDSISFEDAFQNDGIFIRQTATKDFLRRMLKQDDKELYKNLNKIKIENLENKVKRHPDIEDTDRNFLLEFAENTEKIEYWKCYYNMDVDNDGIKEKIVVLFHLATRTVFGWEKFPFKHGMCPVVPGYIFPQTNKPFGIGLPEKLYDVKSEIDNIHNTRADRMQALNDPILMHTRDANYNPFRHKRGFQRNWRLDSIRPEHIRYLETPKLDINSYQDEEIARIWGEKVASIDARSSGVGQPGDPNKTKGGILAVIQEGNIKFRQMIRWLSLQSQKIFTMYFANYRQFWGEEADEQIQSYIQQVLDIPDNPLSGQFEAKVNESSGGINPQQLNNFDAINQSFNLIMTASKRDKEEELRKSLATMEIVKNNPIYESDPTILIKVLTEMMRSLGHRDPETLVPNLERINQREVQLRAQAMQKAIADQQKQQQKNNQIQETIKTDSEGKTELKVLSKRSQ